MMVRGRKPPPPYNKKVLYLQKQNKSKKNMKKAIIIVKIVRYNVAKKFAKAVYTTHEVNRVFSSYTEANKQYNLRNCCYEYQDEEGNVIRKVNNINYKNEW